MKLDECTVGLRVFKARPYNSETYCFYDGSESVVPLNTYGIITEVFHEKKIRVRFDNGKIWVLHSKELDANKLGISSKRVD